MVELNDRRARPGRLAQRTIGARAAELLPPLLRPWRLLGDASRNVPGDGSTMSRMNGDRERVAVIDDEASIRDMLEVGLAQEGFAVRSAVDGADGLTLVRDWQPHCVVLDVMMPKIDGIALIPLLRRLTEVPILMLTARGDVRDRIEGLRAGADDYLPKPFELAELAARIHTALRRPMLRRVEHLNFADLQIDLEARSVRRGEHRPMLSTREFDLLATLARRPNRVFTRDELMDLVWGVDRDISSNTVETYISYLRTKIDVLGKRRLLHTIRGVGYSLREA